MCIRDSITSVQTDISILAFSRDRRVANIQIESRTLGGSIVIIVMSPQAESSDQRSLNNDDGIITQSID